VLNHRVAEIPFSDYAIRLELPISINGATAPAIRAQLAGAIR
jgi:hypothetical protein